MTESKSNLCPLCGGKGKAIKRVTIESMLTEPALGRISDPAGFRFCLTPICDIAYFRNATDERITREGVRVSIGQKESEPSRTVCYCFDHTAEEIEADVALTGTSQIMDEIKENCRQGLDRCAETNPQGSCCLGNVRAVLSAASGSSPECCEGERS